MSTLQGIPSDPSPTVSSAARQAPSDLGEPIAIELVPVSYSTLRNLLPSGEGLDEPRNLMQAADAWAQKAGYAAGVPTFESKGVAREPHPVIAAFPKGLGIERREVADSALALGLGTSTSVWSLCGLCHSYALREGFVSGRPTGKRGRGTHEVLLFPESSGARVVAANLEALRATSQGQLDLKSDATDVNATAFLAWAKQRGYGFGFVVGGSRRYWNAYENNPFDWRRMGVVFPTTLTRVGPQLARLMDLRQELPGMSSAVRKAAYQEISWHLLNDRGRSGAHVADLRSAYTALSFTTRFTDLDASDDRMVNARKDATARGVGDAVFDDVRLQLRKEVSYVTDIRDWRAMLIDNFLDLILRDNDALLQEVYGTVQLQESNGKKLNINWAKFFVDLFADIAVAALGPVGGKGAVEATKAFVEVGMVLAKAGTDLATSFDDPVPSDQRLDAAYTKLLTEANANYERVRRGVEDALYSVLTDWAQMQALGDAIGSGLVNPDLRDVVDSAMHYRFQTRRRYTSLLLPLVWHVRVDPHDNADEKSKAYDKAPSGARFFHPWKRVRTDREDSSGRWRNGQNYTYNDKFHRLLLTDDDGSFPHSTLRAALASYDRLEDILGGSSDWTLRMTCARSGWDYELDKQ